MALVGWRVEWKSSFRDYEGVVVEHSKDKVVVWEYRDFELYEWNPSHKDYQRWNPALKEFAQYHRTRLQKSLQPLKESEICKAIIRMIDALENVPAMTNAKKLAIQIETGKLQAALMEEDVEDVPPPVNKNINDKNKSKDNADDEDKLGVRKTVEFTLPEHIKKQLWKEKQSSDESEEEEDDDDEDDEEDEDEEEDSDETSDQDEDSDEEHNEDHNEEEHVAKVHRGRKKHKQKRAPNPIPKEVPAAVNKTIDIKIMILHTKQLRGFSIPLIEDGFSNMLVKLQQDYGKNITVFYRDEDGDVLNILSLDDLSYAYHSEEKRQTTSIKLKLFAELTATVDLTPPRTAEDRFVNTNAATAIAGERRSFDNANDYKETMTTSERPRLHPPRTASDDRNLRNSQDIFDIVWKKGEVLGVGSFGKVFSGINVSNGVKMAIKEVYIHKAKNTKQQVKALQREVAILSKLDHTNIIKYLGTEFSHDHTLRIFLELANEGSLKDSVREFGALPEPLLRCYAADIVAGLLYLHQLKIIHRDIKPANLLLSNGVVKLADFGCSSPILHGGQSGIETEHSTIAGTTIYMAPEVMQAGSELDENNANDGDRGESSHENQLDGVGEGQKKSIKYGRKADIWSLGMTLCELANGEPPYKNGAAAIYAVCISKQLPKFPAIFSSEAHQFLSRCLNYEVKVRADAAELLQHVFMSPKTLEEVRAQTAASVGLTRNNMASSVHLIPDSEQFQFKTAMSGTEKRGGFADSFFDSKVDRSLRGVNREGDSRFTDGRLAKPGYDSKYDDAISYHEDRNNASDSQFWTCFEKKERPILKKDYRTANDEEVQISPRLNHYLSVPPLTSSLRDSSITARNQITSAKLNANNNKNSSSSVNNNNSRLNDTRTQSTRRKSPQENEEDQYEDDYEV